MEWIYTIDLGLCLFMLLLIFKDILEVEDGESVLGTILIKTFTRKEVNTTKVSKHFLNSNSFYIVKYKDRKGYKGRMDVLIGSEIRLYLDIIDSVYKLNN